MKPAAPRRMFSDSPRPPSLSWIGCIVLVATLAACALPLFLGLGRTDLGNDEAIYSYSVDRMLRLHDWGTPRAIYDDGPFLEKPPLKTWIVTLGIEAGLPRDERGMRFFDALFGAAAFAYVFLIGWRLAGPVCGAVAVFVLFSLPPLVFTHGLRANDMDAAVFLSYCGGFYHFLRWAEEPPGRRRRRHAFALAAYFVLGFMTKFVAVLFLPVTAVLALCWQRGVFGKIRDGWRDWIWPVVAAIALIAPWFVYQHVVNGSFFWETIFGDAVFKRFTSYLDPNHLEPWNFYFVETWRQFTYVGAEWIAAAGVLLLTWRAWRGRPWAARLVWLWGIVPVALISIGTSKIYYYDYPYLPPIALGIGLVAATWLEAAERWIWRAPFDRLRLAGMANRPVLRRVCAAAAALVLFISVWTLFVGTIDWHVDGVRILRNASVVRPLILGIALTALAASWRPLAFAAAGVALALVLPVRTYAANLAETQAVDRPLHAIRDCAVQQVASGAAPRGGIYQIDPDAYTHPYYYYLRQLDPWVRDQPGHDDEIVTRLFEPGQRTVILVPKAEWTDVRHRVEAAAGRGGVAGVSVPLPWSSVRALDGAADVLVLLPGPYAPCLDEAIAAGGRPFALTTSSVDATQ